MTSAQYGKPADVLNDGGAAAGMPSADIAARLRLAINQLAADGIDVERGTVDYARLAGTSAYAEYVEAARMLWSFDPASLETVAEKTAFWLNLYNALIIHAVIAFGVRRSINETRRAFDRAAYVVGGVRYSANEIEHGILRANAGHPLSIGGQFKHGDPRLAFALEKIDPRVHFALVCAARSCPPIAFYRVETLDAQLDLAARHFVGRGNLVVDHGKMRVSLSRIFSWYAHDFGGAWFGYRRADRLLKHIARYTNDIDCAFIEANAARLSVRFMRYDWTLND
ncbi:MAG: DUF547 domain-containing protein [Chloroflexota bacterium]|nr:DUF547 domain-containing protein [Chloroflexota bacterium]